MLAAGGFLPGCGGSTAGSGSDAPGPGSGAPESGDAAKLSLRSLSTSTLYLAHRGAALVYPEHTVEAFDGVLSKTLLLECDVQTLRDGALALVHDLTVDFVSTSSGKVTDFSEAEWRSLQIDANTWHGSRYGSSLRTLLFSDWVARYKGKAILVPEDKDVRSTKAMVSVLDAHNVDKNQVLIQSFNVDALRSAVTAGYEVCYLNSGTPTPLGAIAVGAKWAGISAAASDADTTKWISSGLKVLIWTVNRRSVRDSKLALGVKGFFSDDPEYLSGNAPLTTTDRFDLQTWIPGMLANVWEDGNLLSRGRFSGGEYWGYDSLAVGYLGCLQGYLSPIKKPTAAPTLIEVSVTFDAAEQGNQSRWASAFISKNDAQFIDKSEASAGHHVIFRKNGVVEIYRKSIDSSAVLLSGVVGPSIADGNEVRFRIACSTTGIVVTRLKADGTASVAATASDGSVSPDYLHLGRNGLACRFRKLTVS